MKKSHVVRIFISSTFRDMHAEREEIVRGVLPALRNYFGKRQILIEDIDLRWGVSEEQTATVVCRQEIDRSNIFICLLGERYGTIPAGDNISVTHDEVLYGVLKPKQKNLQSFFYFRKEEASKQVEAEQRSDYWEKVDSVEMQKLKELKESITANNHQVYEYNCNWNQEKACPWDQQKSGCFESFSELNEKMLEDICNCIDSLFPENSEVSSNPFEEQENAMDYFIGAHTKIFVGRDSDLKKINSFITDSDKNYLLITGPSGCGKSSLISKYCSGFTTDNTTLLLYHFVGASSESANIRKILQRFCYYLSKDEAFLEQVSYEDLRKSFLTLLLETDPSRKVVIVIDAINQLDSLYNVADLYWLPEKLPKNIKIILSTLPGKTENNFRERFLFEEWQVNKLENEEKKQFIEKYLSQYGKTLDAQSIETLMQKKESDNPLYLKVVLEECRTLGGSDIYLNIKNIIASLPETVSGLFQKMFIRLENDSYFDKDIIFNLLSTLAVSKGGIQIDELRIILKRADEEQLPAAIWARLYHLLSPYLVMHGEKLTFFHQQVEKSVFSYYLSSQQLIQKAHGMIANFFLAQGFNYLRSLEDVVYHLLHAQMKDKIGEVLTNIEFLENKCFAGMQIEIQQDFDMVLQSPSLFEKDKESLNCLKLLQEGIASEFHNITRFPQLFFQQIYNALHTEVALQGIWSEGIKKHSPSLFKLASCYPEKNKEVKDLQQTISAHQDSVLVVDGRYNSDKFISAGGQEVNVWDYKTKKLLYVFKQHRGLVTAAIISSKNIVYSSGRDGNILIWHADSGDIIGQTKGHLPTTKQLFLSHDQEKLFSVGDKRCICWDTQTHEELFQIEFEEEASSIAVTKDNKKIICAHDKGQISVYDMSSLKLIDTTAGHSETILRIRISQDEKTLATASNDCMVKLWDLDTLELKNAFAHEDWVYDICFMQDNNVFASASGDKLIKLWKLDTFENIGILYGHTDWVYSLAQIDSNTLLSGSEDQTIRFWNIQNTATSKKRVGHNARISSIAIDLSTNKIATASFDKSIQFWDIQQKNYLQEFAYKNKALQSVVFSPDGKMLACAGDDSFIHLWNLQTQQEIVIDSHQEVRIFSLAFSPDNTLLASASRDYSIKIWDAHTQKEVCTCKHGDGVEHVTFSSDGTYLASCARDGFIYFWSLDGTLRKKWKAHNASIEEIAFSIDGKKLASASLDQSAKIWDLETNAAVEISTFGNYLNCLDIKENILVCGCQDKTVHIIDTLTQQKIGLFVCEGVPHVVKIIHENLFIGDEGGILYIVEMPQIDRNTK